MSKLTPPVHKGLTQRVVRPLNWNRKQAPRVLSPDERQRRNRAKRQRRGGGDGARTK